MEELKRFVIPILRNSHIDNVFYANSVQTADFTGINLVVYCDDFGKDSIYTSLPMLLRKLTISKIPLVIYGERRDQSKEEKDLLRQHKWYIFANMPLTLLNHIYSAATIFKQ